MIAAAWLLTVFVADIPIERLIDRGQLAEARRRLAELRQTHPAAPRADLFEAMILFREKQPLEALRLLAQAPEDADTNKLTALCLVALGRSREAGKYIRKAVQLKPDDFMANYYLGMHQLELREWESAVGSFEGARRLNSSYPDVHTMLGLALEELGRGDEALASYRQAVDLAAKTGLAKDAPYVYLSRLLLNRGSAAEALPYAEQAVRLNGASVENWLLVGRAYFDTDRVESAIAAFAKAARLDPKDKRPHYQLMRAYRKAGRDEEARRESDSYRRLSQAEIGDWKDAVTGKP